MEKPISEKIKAAMMYICTDPIILQKTYVLYGFHHIIFQTDY